MLAAPAGHPKKPASLEVLDCKATTEKEMTTYTERVANSDATFQMIPIRGGTFLMGSGEDGVIVQ